MTGQTTVPQIIYRQADIENHNLLEQKPLKEVVAGTLPLSFNKIITRQSKRPDIQFEDTKQASVLDSDMTGMLEL